MKGTLVNAAVVIIGAVLGVALKQGIPKRYQETVTNGLALTVGLIGLQMALKTQNVLILILSIIIGAIVGEKVNIDKFLQYLGDLLTAKMDTKYGNVGQGFVTASLIYCVGAMAVVGSIQEGLTGDASTLYAKSMLDGTLAVVFGSTMGIGVAFSGLSILMYQGTITLMASILGTVISEKAVTEMTAVGVVLIVAVSILMLEIRKIKVANLLPAIPVAAILALFW